MKLKKIISGTVAVILAITGSGIPVFAEGEPDATFRNYSVADVIGQLDGEITLDDELYSGDRFTFHVDADTELPHPAESETNHAEEGKFSFGEIDYDQPGEFHYTVEQTDRNDPNIIYDESVYNVVDTAYLEENPDTGLKELKVTRAISKDGEPADKVLYANYINPPVPADVTLSLAKSYDGEAYSGEAYTYELRNENGELIYSTNVTKDGKATFDSLVFDNEGTFCYTISEVEGEDPNVVYDKTVYGITIQVTVEQDETGRDHYVAEIIGYAKNEAGAGEIRFSGDDIAFDSVAGNSMNDVNVALFQNRTIDPVRITFDGDNAIRKYLDGDVYSGEDYVFIVEGEDYYNTADSVKDGRIQFADIVLNHVGEYHYSIYEKRGTDTSIIYDADVYGLDVTVVREGDALYAVWNYTLNGEEIEGKPVFVNMKVEPAVIKVLANKTLDKEVYDEEKAGEGFEFNLIDAKTEKIIQTKKAVSGVIKFDELKFPEVGTYEYFVKETVGSDPAIVYDKSEYKVVIDVTRDMDKSAYNTSTKYYKKSADGSYAVVETIKFENEFNPVKVKIDGVKTYNSLLYTGTEFTYVLADANGDNKTKPQVIQTTSETKNGVFEFPKELVYSVPGTYKYKVYESAGKDVGIDYDSTVYDLTITVTRDPEKGFVATKELKVGDKVKEAINFANEPKPIATSYQFTARKTLDGKAYNGTAFTYELYDSDGKRIQANNQAVQGTINFGSIRYDKVGRYTYRIKELKGSDGTYKYDEREYIVEVEISLDRTNHKLSAKGIIKTGSTPVKIAEFNNFTNKPAPTPAPTPTPVPTPKPSGTPSDKTGDTSNVGWYGLLGAALIGLGAVYVFSKKKKDKQG